MQILITILLYYFDPYDLNTPIKKYLDTRNYVVYPIDGVSITLEVKLKENIIDLNDSVFPLVGGVKK